MIMAAIAIHPKQNMQKIILIMVFILNVTVGIAQTGFTQLTENTRPVNEKKIIAISISNPTMMLYPNPTKNKVVIQLKGFEAGMAKLQIISDKGIVVRKEDRLLINGDEEVMIFFSLPAGIYFIKITEGEKGAKKRLVVIQ